jgi:Arc/MetJ family transcription regulator
VQPVAIFCSALRRLAGPRLSPEFFDSLEGIGWEGDLDEMRRSKIQDREDARGPGS